MPAEHLPPIVQTTDGSGKEGPGRKTLEVLSPLMFLLPERKFPRTCKYCLRTSRANPWTCPHTIPLIPPRLPLLCRLLSPSSNGLTCPENLAPLAPVTKATVLSFRSAVFKITCLLFFPLGSSAPSSTTWFLSQPGLPHASVSWLLASLLSWGLEIHGSSFSSTTNFHSLDYVVSLPT